MMDAPSASSDASAGIQSTYDGLADFERSMRDVCEQLARGRRFKWEQELLAVFGVVLLVLSALRLISLAFPELEDRFIPGKYLLWGWAAALPWSAWSMWRISRLHEQVIARRLCFCCGESLLEVQTSQRGHGFCPDCGTAFTLGEYVPPAGCLNALRLARSKMMALPRAANIPAPRPPRTRPTAPFFLYENAAHYDRVMRRAAARIAAQHAGVPHLEFATLLAIFAGLGAFGVFVVGVHFAVMIPVLVLAALGISAYDAVRSNTVQSRVIGAKLCLQCGYPLEQLPIDEAGGGRCPECGRAFHALEFVRPPLDWQEPGWQSLRSQCILLDETKLIKREIEPPK